jgi:hypothetical protein
MKTAEEILIKHLLSNHDAKPNKRVSLRDVEVGAMKEYAIQVAEQALKDAADNTYALNDPSSYQIEQSILSTPILTP